MKVHIKTLNSDGENSYFTLILAIIRMQNSCLAIAIAVSWTPPWKRNLSHNVLVIYYIVVPIQLTS